MPKIKFNAGFDETATRIFTEEFNIVTRKLELPGDFEVDCSLEHFDNRGLYARVMRESEKRFSMEVNSNQFNYFDATAAFGHEMIHVEQHLKGWLKVKRENDDIFHSGMEWKGEFFPAFILMLQQGTNCVPWEIDAWKRMGELHKYVVAHMPEKDRALIDISQSTGLKDTWDESYQPWKGCED